MRFCISVGLWDSLMGPISPVRLASEEITSPFGARAWALSSSSHALGEQEEARRAPGGGWWLGRDTKVTGGGTSWRGT